jgi:hypothetical protein
VGQEKQSGLKETENRFDAISHILKGTPRSIDDGVNRTEYNDKEGSSGDDSGADKMRSRISLHEPASGADVPVTSVRIPEPRKLDFDPSPLQPNDIQMKQTEEQIPLNSESESSLYGNYSDYNEFNDGAKDSSSSSDDDDYFYFVPQIREPAPSQQTTQEQLPKPTPTPASITVLLATEEEEEDEAQEEKEKAKEETQISDLSQGNFNSSKATFSTSTPTSSASVNLIPDSRESQTTQVPVLPERENENRMSQIPPTTFIHPQHDDDDDIDIFDHLAIPSSWAGVDKSKEDSIEDQDKEGEVNLVNSFKGDEGKRSPLLTLLYYKGPHYYYYDTANNVNVHDKVPKPTGEVQEMPSNLSTADSDRNPSPIHPYHSLTYTGPKATGDRSDLDGSNSDSIDCQRVKQTQITGTRKSSDSMSSTVLQFGFVLVSLITLAAALMTNLTDQTTYQQNRGLISTVNKVASHHAQILDFPNSAWFQSSPSYNYRRNSMFNLDESLSDDE